MSVVTFMSGSSTFPKGHARVLHAQEALVEASDKALKALAYSALLNEKLALLPAAGGYSLPLILNDSPPP